MSEQDLRNKLVDTAISYYGLKEADGSHKVIIDEYNKISPLPSGYKMKYSDAWCAAFVSAVANVCGLTSIVYAECSCNRMIKLYQINNCWVEKDDYNPLPGDIIFYDWEDTTGSTSDNIGSSDHVGIVVSVDNKSIRVIEGNKSDSVSYRYIDINGKFIRGFGVPDYKGLADKLDKTADSNSSINSDNSLNNIPFNIITKDTPYDFIKFIAPYVFKYFRQYGYKVVSGCLAHAANESGWGVKKLASLYYNYWGMKCGSKWTGKSVNLKTYEEYEINTITEIRDNFRVYDSVESGVEGHCIFLQYNRYKNLYTAETPEEYISYLKEDGYMTDSKAVEKLNKIVNDYELKKYDVLYKNYCEGLYDEENSEVINNDSNKDMQQTSGLGSEATVQSKEDNNENKDSQSVKDKQDKQDAGQDNRQFIIEDANRNYVVDVSALNIRTGPGISFSKYSREALKNTEYYNYTYSNGSLVNRTKIFIEKLYYCKSGEVWGKLKSIEAYVCIRMINSSSYYCLIAS